MSQRFGCHCQCGRSIGLTDLGLETGCIRAEWLLSGVGRAGVQFVAENAALFFAVASRFCWPGREVSTVVSRAGDMTSALGRLQVEVECSEFRFDDTESVPEYVYGDLEQYVVDIRPMGYVPSHGCCGVAVALARAMEMMREKTECLSCPPCRRDP